MTAPTAAAIANASVNGRRSEASSFAERSRTIACSPPGRRRRRGSAVRRPSTDPCAGPAGAERGRRRPAGGGAPPAGSRGSTGAPAASRRRRRGSVSWPAGGVALAARRSARPARASESSARRLHRAPHEQRGDDERHPDGGEDRDRDRRELARPERPHRPRLERCSRLDGFVAGAADRPDQLGPVRACAAAERRARQPSAFRRRSRSPRPARAAASRERTRRGSAIR